MRGYMNRLLVVGLIALFVIGCDRTDTRPGKEVTVRVIYTDRDTINEKAREYGLTEQANGFYNRLSNTMYCPDEETPDAFRTCGHELRHVVKGDFHK